MVDHEGGSVQRLNGEGFTILPSWKRMCNQTAELRQSSLASSAAELAAVGIDVVLAPVVDVSHSNIVLRDRVLMAAQLLLPQLLVILSRLFLHKASCQS